MATVRRSSQGSRSKTTARSARTARLAAAAVRPDRRLPFLIGGAVAGVLLLIVVVAVLASGSGKKEERRKESATSPKEDSGPRTNPELHQSGLQKCEAGLRLLQAAEPRIARRKSMSDREVDDLVADLERAGRLLQEGMQDIENSGIKEHVNQYMNAKAGVRSYLKELAR